jgi:hypothetical protein
VSGGAVVDFTITSAGVDYAVGDLLSVSNTDLGGTGSGLELTVDEVNPRSENAILHWNHTTGKWVSQDGVPHEIPMSFSVLAPIPTAGDTKTGFPELVLAEYIAPVDMILYRYTPGSNFIVSHSDFGTGTDKYTPLIFNLYMGNPILVGDFENEIVFTQVGEVVRGRSGNSGIDHTFCNFFEANDLIIPKGSTLRLTLDPSQPQFAELSPTGNGGSPDFITGSFTFVAITKKIEPPQRLTLSPVTLNTNLGGGADGGAGFYRWEFVSESAQTYDISMEYFITNWNTLIASNEFNRLYELLFDIQGSFADPSINDVLATLDLNTGSPSYDGVTADLSENNYFIFGHGIKFTYDGTPLMAGVYTVTFKVYDYGSGSVLPGTCSFEVEVFRAA